MPDSFCQMPEGRVLIANGMQPMLRWDGMASTCESAGVQPPPSACTMSGSGLGAIVGTYEAYVRFYDLYLNYSNLSPVSADTVIQSASANITNATGDAPIVITSNGHGLTTGSTVIIADVGGVTQANSSWIITVVDQNNFSLDGSDGYSQSYSTGGTWASGVATLTYSEVPLPAESKVTGRQILRNTDGQFTTFYVDVDTKDLISSSLSSTNADTILSANQAVPLLDSNGIPFADSHGIPPNHKKALVAILDRMFAAAQVNYTQGNVSVAFGSSTVYGIGTEWTESLPGRFLYVRGAQSSYQIGTVDTVKQTLTLWNAYLNETAPYLDETTAYQTYAISPAPAEDRLVYYSEAGESESWPPINAISLDADGDEITGLMVMGSFLYITERRHIYRFTFQNDPATDGMVFIASTSRGCVNQRCWVAIDDAMLCLDEQGIHSFDGSFQCTPISTQIQDIFRFADTPYEINWEASDFFHAIHYPPQETVRWFVCLSGHYLPRHAIGYNYRLQRWWIEEYAHPIASSSNGSLNGRSVVYLGADAGRVLAFWSNTLDGPDPTAGTVRGTVTAAGLLSLTDASASFPVSGLVGSPIVICDGTGVDQVRRIVAVASQTITIDRPWAAIPDTTSSYQIGGIPWLWQSKWFRYVVSEEQKERRLEVVWNPTDNEATARLRLYLDDDGLDNAVLWKVAYNSSDANGVRSQNGSPDLVIDLTKVSGFAQKRLDQHREVYIDGPRFMAIDLRGVSNLDQVAIEQITIDGVMA